MSLKSKTDKESEKQESKKEEPREKKPSSGAGTMKYQLQTIAMRPDGSRNPAVHEKSISAIAPADCKTVADVLEMCKAVHAEELAAGASGYSVYVIDVPSGLGFNKSYTGVSDLKAALDAAIKDASAEDFKPTKIK